MTENEIAVNAPHGAQDAANGETERYRALREAERDYAAALRHLAGVSGAGLHGFAAGGEAAAAGEADAALRRYRAALDAAYEHAPRRCLPSMIDVVRRNAAADARAGRDERTRDDGDGGWQTNDGGELRAVQRLAAAADRFAMAQAMQRFAERTPSEREWHDPAPFVHGPGAGERFADEARDARNEALSGLAEAAVEVFAAVRAYPHPEEEAGRVLAAAKACLPPMLGGVSRLGRMRPLVAAAQAFAHARDGQIEANRAADRAADTGPERAAARAREDAARDASNEALAALAAAAAG